MISSSFVLLVFRGNGTLRNPCSVDERRTIQPPTVEFVGPLGTAKTSKCQAREKGSGLRATVWDGFTWARTTVIQSDSSCENPKPR